MNWMDIGAVIILAATSIEGYMKGLIISFISMVGWVVATIVSMNFYPVVANYLIEKTVIYTKIVTAINNKVTVASNIGESNQVPDLSSYIKLPKILDHFIIQPDSNTTPFIGSTVGDIAAKLMIDIISMVLIFIVVKILLMVIAHVLDKFSKLPVLNQLNRFSGLLFGIAKGCIIVFVLLAVLVPIIGITQSSFIIRGLESSTFVEYLYDNNLILTFIKGYLTE